MERYQPFRPALEFPVAIEVERPQAAAMTPARCDPPKWSSIMVGYCSYCSMALRATSVTMSLTISWVGLTLSFGLGFFQSTLYLSLM